MIGKLRGIVDTIDTDSIILDVSGVGYKVHCSATTLRNLPSKDENVSLFIETMVREDAFNLYGFITQSEQNAFKELIKVGGVGNKVALAILGSLTAEQIVHAVTLQDKSLFQQVSELKDRITNDILAQDATSLPAPGLQAQPTAPQTSVSTSYIQDAISALVNLGYQRDIAYKVITKISKEHGDTIETGELIRIALKEFATV